VGESLSFLATSPELHAKLLAAGIAPARAVDDPDLSERILAVCRQAVERLAVPGTEPPTDPGEADHAGC